MSEVKLVLRDSTRDITDTCHGSTAQRLVAALSADPMTIEELDVALERFEAWASRSPFSIRQPGCDDEPWDAGLVVIDLAARLVVVDSIYFSPSPTGSVNYHNGRHCTDIEVCYDLADEWILTTNSHNWRGFAKSLRRERAERGVLDVRGILYGRPLLEFLATECFQTFPRREIIAQASRVKAAARRSGSHADTAAKLTDSGPNIPPENEADSPMTPDEKRHASPFYDTLKEIHIRWLMTPREELRGQTPREVLLEDHEHRMNDMQHRCDQWSRMQSCPRPLETTAHAFQFGGFGTHEIVKYYDLVRELLWSCWDELNEIAQSPDPARWPTSLTLSDFLAVEVPRLERVRETWMDTADPAFEFHTPRSIIDHERARIPEAVSGAEAMIDPDCPCCQMLAELPGPMFWHLDGSGMDSEYAFDIFHRTFEEWDRQQASYERIANHDDDECSGTDSGNDENSDSHSIWSCSFSMADAPDVPMGVRLFGLGGHLGELTLDLRELPEGRQFVGQINRDFGNLREVLSGAEDGVVSTLLSPTITRFAETLDDIAAACPDLEPKCNDLIRKLELLNRSQQR